MLPRSLLRVPRWWSRSPLRGKSRHFVFKAVDMCSNVIVCHRQFKKIEMNEKYDAHENWIFIQVQLHLPLFYHVVVFTQYKTSYIM